MVRSHPPPPGTTPERTASFPLTHELGGMARGSLLGRLPPGRRAAGRDGPPHSRGHPIHQTGSITQRDAVPMVGWKTTWAPTLPFASKYLPLRVCLMDFGLPDVVVHF